MTINNYIIKTFIAISMLTSCTAKEPQLQYKDSYIVLDKQGLTFTIYTLLTYENEPSKQQIQKNLKESKRIARKELGKYHIIESCITDKDWIISEIKNNINKSLRNEKYFSNFRVDSILVDEYTKQKIISRFGTEYKIE